MPSLPHPRSFCSGGSHPGHSPEPPGRPPHTHSIPGSGCNPGLSPLGGSRVQTRLTEPASPESTLQTRLTPPPPSRHGEDGGHGGGCGSCLERGRSAEGELLSRNRRREGPAGVARRGARRRHLAGTELAPGGRGARLEAAGASSPGGVGSAPAGRAVSCPWSCTLRCG